MYQVFDRARPFDENVLSPGGMLYGKAEGNPSGVDSDWDAYYRIAYGVVSSLKGHWDEKALTCLRSQLLTRP